MGAAADKGWGGLNNTSPMDGPAQITQLADFLAGIIDREVATPGDLPSSGNWVGRQILVVSTTTIYRWASTGWVSVAGWGTAGNVLGAAANVDVDVSTWVKKRPDNIVEGYIRLGRPVANGGIVNNTVFGIIGSGYRPASGSNPIFAGFVVGSTSQAALVQIHDSGNVRFYQSGSIPGNAASFGVLFSYPAGN